MQLTIAQDSDRLHAALVELARAGKRIALVPTMGALHEGHIQLMKAAQEEADAVLATIFVNPKQFGQNEDFSIYPRTLEQDIAALDKAGVQLLYTPSAEDMYPEGFTTGIHPGPMASILCGAYRPGHFEGVATVVTKLLLRTLPYVAFFGEKDYQQLCIIRQVTDDLDIPVEIVGVPTIREPDGLALSSRNRYLSEQERHLAPQIYKTLQHVTVQIQSGIVVEHALQHGKNALQAAGFKVDYLELRQEDTLQAMQQLDTQARLLVAVRLGTTRLIDNIPVEPTYE